MDQGILQGELLVKSRPRPDSGESDDKEDDIVHTDTGGSTHPIEVEQDNSGPMAEAAAGRRRTKHHRSAQLDQMLEDAEHLLNHAVEGGIEVEADIAKRIIAAIGVGPAVWDGSDAGDLTNAITKLAAKLYPVTAETLRASREDAHKAISDYKKIAFWLAALIIPLSIGAFICTGISNMNSTDIKKANELLLGLHARFDTPKLPVNDEASPSGSLGELQQFAVLMRAIYSRTKQVNWLDPFSSDTLSPESRNNLELPANLENSMKGLQSELNKKTPTYQDVRVYATAVQDDISLLWGAVGNFILPMLYALLGACASVLRAFTEQLKARTFAPTYATPARFVIAAIGGGVVGLFSNFTIGQNLSLPPLALAFLVGYATDIFFSFLEGSMPNLGKVKQR
jgi:hypothetical protein